MTNCFVSLFRLKMHMILFRDNLLDVVCTYYCVAWVACLVLVTIGELSSKCEGFRAIRSQFDGDHAPICCISAIFVRPLFEFYFPLFFTKQILNNAAFRHRRDVYAARLMDMRNRKLRCANDGAGSSHGDGKSPFMIL